MDKKESNYVKDIMHMKRRIKKQVKEQLPSHQISDLASRLSILRTAPEKYRHKESKDDLQKRIHILHKLLNENANKQESDINQQVTQSQQVPPARNVSQYAAVMSMSEAYTRIHELNQQRIKQIKQDIMSLSCRMDVLGYSTTSNLASQIDLNDQNIKSNASVQVVSDDDYTEIIEK